ncbi:MAG: hypothetical protein ACYDDU_22335 [Dermatophilaceae bacterium]
MASSSLALASGVAAPTRATIARSPGLSQAPAIPSSSSFGAIP